LLAALTTTQRAALAETLRNLLESLGDTTEQSDSRVSTDRARDPGGLRDPD